MNTTTLNNTQTLIDWANKQKKDIKSRNTNAKKNTVKKDDITKLNIGDKSNLNLDDLNSMYEQVQNALKKQDANNPIICDSECKANKKESKLYDKYVLAKSNYEKSPDEYSEARKNYYMYSKGGTWYSNFLLKESQSTIDTTINEFNNRFNDKYNAIEDSINALNIHKKYNHHVNNLNNHMQDKANSTEEDANNIQNKANINMRLTHYYHQQIVYINRFIQVFKFIYWSLVIMLVIFIIILQKKYKNFKILSITFLFIIIPYVLNRIIYYVYANTTQPDHHILH